MVWKRLVGGLGFFPLGSHSLDARISWCFITGLDCLHVSVSLHPRYSRLFPLVSSCCRRGPGAAVPYLPAPSAFPKALCGISKSTRYLCRETKTSPKPFCCPEPCVGCHWSLPLWWHVGNALPCLWGMLGEVINWVYVCIVFWRRNVLWKLSSVISPETLWGGSLVESLLFQLRGSSVDNSSVRVIKIVSAGKPLHGSYKIKNNIHFQQLNWANWSAASPSSSTAWQTE